MPQWLDIPHNYGISPLHIFGLTFHPFLYDRHSEFLSSSLLLKTTKYYTGRVPVHLYMCICRSAYVHTGIGGETFRLATVARHFSSDRNLIRRYIDKQAQGQIIPRSRASYCRPLYDSTHVLNSGKQDRRKCFLVSCYRHGFHR